MTGSFWDLYPYFLFDLPSFPGGKLILGGVIFLVGVLMLLLLRSTQNVVRYSGLGLFAASVAVAGMLVSPVIQEANSWTTVRGSVEHAEGLGTKSEPISDFAFKPNSISADGTYHSGKQYACLGSKCSQLANLNVYITALCQTAIWPIEAARGATTECVVVETVKTLKD